MTTWLQSADDASVWVLNVAIQVTFISAIGLLATRKMFRHAATMRCTVLTVTLMLLLLVPVIAGVSQWSEKSAFVVAAPPQHRTNSESTTVQPTPERLTDFTGPRLPETALTVPSRISAQRTTFGELPRLSEHKLPVTEQNSQSLASSKAAPTTTTNWTVTTNIPESTINLKFLHVGMILWAIGAFVVVLRFVSGFRQLRRILESATDVKDDYTQQIFQQLVQSHRRSPGPKLLESSEVTSPFTTGCVNTAIVIPLNFAKDFSDDEIRLILMHELAHAFRHDPVVLMLQNIATIVYWPNPLIWLLNRELAQAREEVCDNYVLHQTDATTYGRLLLNVGKTFQAKHIVAGTLSLFSSRWRLESRISGLLDSRRDASVTLTGAGKRFITALGLCVVGGIFAATLSVTDAAPANFGDEQSGKQTRQDNAANPSAVKQQSPEGDDAFDAVHNKRIAQAKEAFRTSREDSAARRNAAEILYPLIRTGMSKTEILTLLGSPDMAPERRNHRRFLNYRISDNEWIEIEFDDDRREVVRKSADGLKFDSPQEPIGPINDRDRQWLADYPVKAERRTILRAGFVPVAASPVWGQPLTVELTATNIGNEDFEFSFGGDYRGTGRHERIKIKVVDASGKELPDPIPNRMDMGGISSFELITPRGQSFSRIIDITKYRTIPGPGKYRITCSFAFDEPYTPVDKRLKPVVKSEFEFTIRPRTPDNIREVLDTLNTRVQSAPPKELPDLMQAIATFGREDALPQLKTYLASGSSEQQTAATGALPLIPGEDSLNTAVSLLQSDGGPLQQSAAAALGRFPDAAGTNALLSALIKHDSPTPLRQTLLKSLGATRSERGISFLEEALKENGDCRFAAVEGLAYVGGPRATSILREQTASSDFALRFKVVKALAEVLREPIEPEWLLPILMCRRHNSREWLDSLSTIRIWCGERAVPALLSVVDFDVPWSHRNFWILHHVKYARGAPEFDYQYDPNSQGTPAQHEHNRKLLARLKPLAGPRPENHFWPGPAVKPLVTEPPIDFSVQLSTLKGTGETRATVTCGFFKETWDRNGGSSSFRPTGSHAATYQIARDVRAVLKSDEAARETGLNEDQLAALRQLNIPPESPVIEEGLNLLYIWWQEAPLGQIRLRAHQRLRNAVQRGVQQHHLDHVAFANAAKKIMQPGLEAVQPAQQIQSGPRYEIQRVHPDMANSKVWLELKNRLESSAVKYVWVEVEKDGTCRLSLNATPTSDLSHLQGMPLQYLDVEHTAVRDLKPLMGMPLRDLRLSGSQVHSLKGLEGMPLTSIDISGTGVRDLRPIADAKLTSFVSLGSSVIDLTPLRGMPLSYIDIRKTGIRDITPVVNPELRSLQLENCPVTDLSPLAEIKLDSLWLAELNNVDVTTIRNLKFRRLTLKGQQFKDVQFLSGLQLADLSLLNTQVSDLSPLQGLPLTKLSIAGLPLSDLSFIEGMDLQVLSIRAAEDLDLSPLSNLPLTDISIANIAGAKNVETLRSIRTLETIRTDGKPLPVKTFWKRYSAGAFRQVEQRAE